MTHPSNLTRKILLIAMILILLVSYAQVHASDHPKPLGTIYNGDPGNYRSLLDQLQPGDTLQLEAGTYTEGLPLNNLNGTAAAPIIIAGPENGARAVFTARTCCNTISIVTSSYVEIYNLELDGQDLGGVDAVKVEGTANNWAHHITLENLYIHRHDNGQQTVGINTKAPAWNWTVRRNIIASAGTGMYFGDSDGGDPFVNSLIEGNLIVDTIGYNIQIKHQTGSRPTDLGMPTSGTTIIRHNVFSKANNASTGPNARPNLLVGHWPLSGAGVSDVYQIYGNFFYQNPTGESLFQGEGNVALYNNLFVNTVGHAIAIQAQNDVPKMIRVFNNSVLASGTGIRVSGGDSNFEQKVIGNAVFGATPINAADVADNVTDSLANAANYLTSPGGDPANGTLDLYPLPGTLTGPPLDSSSFETFVEWDHDFNGDAHDGTFRGAYAGEGQNPGWLPRLERKPLNPPVFDHQVYLPAILK